MYVLIEHNGSEEHVKFAKELQEYLEDEWGTTVEQVVGNYERVLTLYNENLERLTELLPTDDISVLAFYMNHYYEED